ncbi:response regulator transcription factor [Chryseobacterium sp. cx-311]|uniref:response regulator transcription factor n=1 Tax=Marnyiella aurantia TaxID=2758037 RepID=UPI001AE73F35|nr:response regulator transcription factor [Marnyiella aurantia]MBP0612921.1 response regulator transcription factor [Marnyiella aurantia]
MQIRVLIAEDHEIENIGVINTLKELNVSEYSFANYCDDAYALLQKALKEDKPFDLLITDLGFVSDHRVQKLNSGQSLIREARALQPGLKIIAFSIEKRAAVIDELFKIYDVDGFVSKGRNDGKELRSTIIKVMDGDKVMPQHILNSIRNTTQNLTPYDIQLLQLIAKGWKQKEVEEYYKEHGIKPDSRSAIEKRLNDLRETLNARNNIEMIVMCKDLGLI